MGRLFACAGAGVAVGFVPERQFKDSSNVRGREFFTFGKHSLEKRRDGYS